MKKILTIIFDGFGMREDKDGNVVKQEDMTHFNKLWDEYPHSLLEASGESLGLHEGQVGNCETGHQIIGAGRIIKQNETLVDEFLSGDVLNNENFQKLISNKDKDIHLMGYANIKHFIKLYELLVKNGIKKIHFHLITTLLDNALSINYIRTIKELINKYKIGDIATICGRHYVMDKSQNYDMIQKYYELVTKGIGININNIEENRLYQSSDKDDFINPIIVNNNSTIRNGDVLVLLNYKKDEYKQITSSFTNNMNELEVYSFLKNDDEIKTNYFIEDNNNSDSLGVYLSKLGLTQARIAEDEKYPYITYFFDNGYNGKLNKCSLFNIPSQEVSSYNLRPEMGAVPITKKAIECMMQDYDFILLNFANADMVSRTRDYDATAKAYIALDLCLNKLMEQAEENFYKVIILSDHGNTEEMFDNKGNIITNHTSNKVPFIIIDKSIKLKQTGDLTMVAPTILEYMDIAVPEEMSETDILIEK